MLCLAKRIVARLLGETHASEIAEAAAVLPIVFMMVLGVFWFGQAFRIYGTITHAARQGARAGSTPVCTTCPTGVSTNAQNAYNAVQSALSSAKLDPGQVLPPTPPPSVVSCSSGAAVACTNIGNVCIQQNIQMSQIGSGASGVCGISVSFQYPYQFWLPFTTLNMQRIKLQAVARTRMEMP